MDKELYDSAVEFMGSFERVFGNDWDHTRSSISVEDRRYIKGTFLAPNVEDESNDWSNRGALLSAYREFRKILEARGYQSDEL